MGTPCIYLNFKLIWPNSAKLRGGGVVTGASLRCDMGGGGRAIFCFMCELQLCMVEQYVGLMSSKIFIKIVQLDTLMCICLSDVGINNFYIK